MACLLALALLVQALPALAQGEPNPPMTVYLWSEDGAVSVSQGPIAMKVLVNGTLSNAGAQFKIFWDYIKDWDGRSGFLAEGYAEGFNYSIVITIPPAAAGEHYIIVEDEKDHSTKTAVFTVAPEITIMPMTGPSGVNATVEGYLINNETITLKFYDSNTGEELDLAVVETGSDGYFTANITIPQVDEGVHYVRAYLGDGLQAEAPFAVGYSISASPEAAPSGAPVTILGVFAVNENLTVSFANDTWSVDVASATSGGDGSFSVDTIVPEASPGDYFIRAYNDRLTVEAPFTINSPPQIFLNATEIVSGKGLWIGGVNFCPNSTVAIFLLSEPILLATANTTDIGEFTAEAVIPEVSPGEHLITAIDPVYQVPGNTTVTVHGVTIKPLSSMYLTNDVINFLVNSTTAFENDSVINIQVYDPYGVPFSSVSISENEIVNVNGFYVAPYYASRVFLSIPRGAPEGTWTWNATYSLELYPGEVFTASGTFTVSEEPSVNLVLQRLDEMNAVILGIADVADDTYLLLETTRGDILAKLDELNATLTDAVMDAEGNIIAHIDTVVGDIEVELSDLNIMVTSIQNDVATIETNLGTVKSDVETLKSMISSMSGQISSIQDDIATIEAGVNDLQVNLTAIHAEIASLNGSIAVLHTDLGDLKASVEALDAEVAEIIEDAEGNIVARIETAVGSVEARLGSLNAILTDIQGDIAVIETDFGTVKANLSAVKNMVSSMDGKISSIEGDIALINSTLGSLTVNLTALDSKISEVKGGVAEIETSIGTLRADLQDLNASIVSLNGTLATVQTILGEVNVSVTDLGAAVTSIDENLNATVSTALGELRGTVTSIHDNIANVVVPELGSIEAAILQTEETARNAESATMGVATIIYITAATAAAAAALAAATLILMLRRKAA